ncbi:MAG: phosphoribosylamine--glycine ligase [Flavobacteriales bacterium]|nr:phosphoribosylamine--glycine ligase [Flavobacteriales bacterium]
MNILILGSGGREHAIAWKLKQSKKTSQLFIAPGNAGTAQVGENVSLSLSNFDSIANFIKDNAVEMLVVGPEAPLVEGIVDYFEAASEFSNLKIIGPSKYAAQLEGSKEFAKEFMMRNNVPTARFQSFTAKNIEKGYAFLEGLKSPYVLKADGLAGGKGVLILNNLDEAKNELKSMLVDAKFGAASSNVVIEEFLSGIEMSVFVLTDGVNYQVLPEAKDYKRIGEGDTGLNTGGMGAVSPVPFVNDELRERIIKNVVEPSVNGLAKEKFNYKGFLFIGLMIVDNYPFVIEYNVRMGDPETEVVMPRIKSDLVEHLEACSEGRMNETEVVFEENAATTVMLVAEGYPEAYEKGKEMTGFDLTSDCILFHAGTKQDKDKVLTNGGRILAVSAVGENFKDALSKTFRNAEKINYDGKYYRKDIGFDLMEF